MLDAQISDLQAGALKRIGAARSPDEIESVRVEVLGRKGVLTQVSKDMGKLAPEERARVGKLLNAAKQALEEAFERRKQEFDAAALRERLDAEWLDLTLPAPGPRAGSLHPITQIQMEIEEDWDWTTYLNHYEEMKVRHQAVISEYNGNRKGTIGLNDLTIIALAKTLGLPVVSSEKKTSVDQDSNKRQKIPDICAKEDVDHISFNDLLRAEGIRN